MRLISKNKEIRTVKKADVLVSHELIEHCLHKITIVHTSNFGKESNQDMSMKSLTVNRMRNDFKFVDETATHTYFMTVKYQ